MNKTPSFFSRFCHSPVPCRVAVMLVVLAWSSLAFCGELHDAVKAGDLEKVKTLLKDNPESVFSKDDNGATPLHAAALMAHKDVAELLLANKADVNATNNYGMTPLHVAAVKGHKDVAELLLANKAEVNAEDTAGDTPLHNAVLGGFGDVAELLRQRGGRETLQRENAALTSQNAKVVSKVGKAEPASTDKNGGQENILDAYKHYQEALKAYNKLEAIGPDSLTTLRKQLTGVLLEGLNEDVLNTVNRPALKDLGPSGKARFIDALNEALEKRKVLWAAFENAVSAVNQTKEELPVTEGLKSVTKQWGRWLARNLLENAVSSFWDYFCYQTDTAGGPAEVLAILKANDTTINNIEKYSRGAKAPGEDPFFVARDDFQKMANAEALAKDMYSSDSKKAEAELDSSHLALTVKSRFANGQQGGMKELLKIRAQMESYVNSILGRLFLDQLLAKEKMEEAKGAYERLRDKTNSH